jgi:hypothetical protein
MKRRSAAGDRLWTSVMIRVFDAGNKSAVTKRYVAPAGKGYTSAAIDEMLDTVAADLERRRPNDDYEVVQAGTAQFNFVWRARRETDIGQEAAKA